jgi:endonuclease III
VASDRKAKVDRLLDTLEAHHGAPLEPHPTDAYEMILHRNAGYPQSDLRCDAGYSALEKAIGTSPQKILAAKEAKLVEALRAGGMVPELRAARLREIATRVRDDWGGDLRGLLSKPIREVRRALKSLPTIGDPTADKILLFSGTEPVAAVPSNVVHVLPRLGVGLEGKSYDATYRSVRDALDEALPVSREARIRAYLLVKRHGESLCKATRPKCDECPLRSVCDHAKTATSKH